MGLPRSSVSSFLSVSLSFRRMKEKYELTEVHKQLNRMQFGVEEDQNGLKGKQGKKWGAEK